MRNLGLGDLGFLGAVGGGGYTPTDATAAAYVTAVESVDGQALEPAVRQAIDEFVIGCKADGIWTAIKASCILAGARTLSGALVPLVGSAPTNNNFVSNDYNRKTGLVGNGSSKYLNSNRTPSNQPQNSMHLSVHATIGLQSPGAHIGATDTSPSLNVTQIIHNNSSGLLSFTINYSSGPNEPGPAGSASGFMGTSRSMSSSCQARVNQTGFTLTNDSVTPNARNIFVFARNLNGSPNFYGSSRLAFYSIGESLDLAKLDTRVTTLINAFGTAIA